MFEIQKTSPNGPRVLYTLDVCEEADIWVQDCGYFVDWSSQVKTSIVHDGKDVYSAPLLGVESN